MKRSGYRLRNKINKSKLIYLEDGFIHSYGMKKIRFHFQFVLIKMEFTINTIVRVNYSI